MEGRPGARLQIDCRKKHCGLNAERYFSIFGEIRGAISLRIEFIHLAGWYTICMAIRAKISFLNFPWMSLLWKADQRRVHVS